MTHPIVRLTTQSMNREAAEAYRRSHEDILSGVAPSAEWTLDWRKPSIFSRCPDQYGTDVWFRIEMEPGDLTGALLLDLPGLKPEIGYYVNREYHREDGPAVINMDGSEEFCLYGLVVPVEAYAKALVIVATVEESKRRDFLNDWLEENYPEDAKQ